MQNNGLLSLGVVVAVVIAIVALTFSLKQGPTAGGITNYDELDATAIKIGGTNGTRVGPWIPKTCVLIENGAVAASSTKPYDCAVTGVVAGDYVLAQLATSTVVGTAQTYWSISAAQASTTSGFVTVMLYNNGPALVPSTIGVGSTTQVWVAHPVTSVPGL